jgi:quercetin dioxygenase-like cupin family protein
VVPSYWFLDQLIDVLVDGRQTDGRYSLLEAHVPQGHQTPLHVHRDAAQAMYVLEGEQTVWVGDQVHTLARGDALDAPRGVPHTHKSTGTGPSRVLLLSIPAGLEGYICVAGTPGEERAQLDGTDMQRPECCPQSSRRASARPASPGRPRGSSAPASVCPGGPLGPRGAARPAGVPGLAHGSPA